MADEHLRQLEREAQTGDLQAGAKLLLERSIHSEDPGRDPP